MAWFRMFLLALAACHSGPVESFFLQRPSTTIGSRILTAQAQKDDHHWQSHVSTHPDGFNAFKQIWSDVTHKDRLDLAFLFVGQAHASDFEQLVQHAKLQMSGAGRPIQLISLIGGGVIGENVELDETQRPSMSLLIGGLPEGARVDVVEYTNKPRNDDDDDDNLQLEFDDIIASGLVFADPWAPVERLVSASPLRVLAGGISCPNLADQSSLAVDNRCLPQGSMIGIGFAGSLGLQTMVAQGCRPVGSIFKITACEGNVVTKLDNKPALQVLQEVANGAPPEEQAQIESGLLCGISSSSSWKNDDDEDKTPDFLSRQIVGFAPSVQGIAIGTTEIHEGDLLCFQVRDGTTAEQDLQLMVQRAKTARLFDSVKSAPVAVLQISCVARGRGMFEGVPNVDLSNVKHLVGDRETPVVAGFFANGEIGPVGLAGFSSTMKGKSYLHSFTTVAAMLCEYADSQDSSSNDGVVQESLDAWG